MKPEKCKSIVIEKGKISTRTINKDGKTITFITEKPVKYPGKTCNVILDEKPLGETIKQAKKARLLGRYNAWIVKHMLLPRSISQYHSYIIMLTVCIPNPQKLNFTVYGNNRETVKVAKARNF